MTSVLIDAVKEGIGKKGGYSICCSDLPRMDELNCKIVLLRCILTAVWLFDSRILYVPCNNDSVYSSCCTNERVRYAEGMQ